ncbi:threonylcarbamoyl-AMP synthase [Collinsella sp. zg1085]|uniref:L-threonylcarbamoyladenylate synthase n=1 Tax=Collinsella sp. zg1085 TaxID=2844380 RepID=UPI001C0CB0BC|nr:L-threonylcarbamoyladenylate synthase [Collinsella sp. zg1085]QWT17719.1 threonylcarbamoyl-AMP synthase [Collinsella sp. zg1085]
MQTVFRVPVNIERPRALVLVHAAAELCAGGLVLLPTETVYGIGVAVKAFAGSDAATASMPPSHSGYGRIFSLKQRSLQQTVPWLVSGAQDLDVYGVNVDPRARALAQAFWPGALTIVVQASAAVPTFMQASDGTVALRASASPVIQGLINVSHSPLAVTSANTHGCPAPSSFDEVEPVILAGVDMAIDAGATPCHEASTIVSFETGEPVILREGALSSEQIMSCCARVCTPNTTTHAPRAAQIHAPASQSHASSTSVIGTTASPSISIDTSR